MGKHGDASRFAHPGFKDMTGAELASCVVLRRAANVSGNACWLVRAACGHEIVLTGIYLRESAKQGRSVRCRACQPKPSVKRGGATLGEPSREQLRSRRKRPVRPRTLSVVRLPQYELERGRREYPEDIDDRPRTRGDCCEGFRPCPYVSCAHHLYLDVSQRTGAIKLNFPDLEPTDMTESCALDVAERGGATLEDVAAFLNVTRERVRQIENVALARLQRQAPVNPVVRRFLAMGSE